MCCNPKSPLKEYRRYLISVNLVNAGEGSCQSILLVSWMSRDDLKTSRRPAASQRSKWLEPPFKIIPTGFAGVFDELQTCLEASRHSKNDMGAV